MKLTPLYDLHRFYQLFFKVVDGVFPSVDRGRHRGDTSETAVKHFYIFKTALRGDLFYRSGIFFQHETRFGYPPLQQVIMRGAVQIFFEFTEQLIAADPRRM